MDRYAHMDSDRSVRAIMLQSDNADVLAQWADAVKVEEVDAFDSEKKYPGLNVQCGLEVKRASVGDYVLKHDDGTFDVLQPMKFAANFIKMEWKAEEE